MFQVIVFLHTVLTCELVELKTALVVCPLNTVLNWRAEFDKWQRDITKKKMEVSVFSKCNGKKYACIKKILSFPDSTYLEFY